MSEERAERYTDKRESPTHVSGNDYSEGGAVPMRMQMFSTWEVRKVPANCVSRLCVLTVIRLQVVRPLSGTGLVVLSASMKTPHRVLRSNQMSLRANGMLDIPLEWTYQLQYPHFLKRGGNILLIRLQRRKTVRNRPLGGYKTLAVGTLDMSQVLQHSFQGEVKLYSQKGSEHLASVTVGTLTSNPSHMERRTHEASSEEDDDDIFSDDLAERVSDSESGGEEQAFADPVAHEKVRRFMPSTAALLRLLRRSRPSKRGHHDPVGELLEEEVEFRESSVAFASSPSDSDDEISTGVAPSPPRPTLSPFFGSDRCSMVSLPTSAKSAESMTKLKLEGKNPLLKKHGSMDEPIKAMMESSKLSGGDESDYDWDFARGRLWCVLEGLAAGQAVARGLEREREVVQWVEGDKDCLQKLLSLMNTLHKKWRDRRPFTVVLVGNDGLVSSAVQALVSASCSPSILRFAIIPIAAGLMSARLASLDNQFQEAFPPEGPWLDALQDGIDHLLHYIERAEHSLPLPLAQAVIQRPLKEHGAYEEVFLPFMCNVSIGSSEIDASPDIGPLSPPGAGQAMEYPEISLEYWSPRGQKSQQGSVKVRSAIISCADSVLNVTATKLDKKIKGIRIRKPKEAETGGSIVSLTATQLICRPVTKVKAEGGVSVVVDGVEREGVRLVRLSANWEHTLNRTFSLAITNTLDRIN